MGLRDEIVSVLLAITVDQSKTKAAQQSLDNTRERLDDVADAAKRVTVAAPDVGKTIAKNTDAAAGSVLRLRDAYDAVRKSAMAAGKASASSGGGGIGDRIGSIGGAGGLALSAVGLGEAGQLLAAIGDVAGLEKVAGDMKELVKSIAPLQGIATALTPALGATGAAFASVGLVIAPIAAALLGVVAVFKSLEDSAKRATEAQQAEIDARNKQLDLEFQIKQDAQNKTKEQLAQEYDNVQAQYELTKSKLELARQEKARIDAEYAALGNALNPQARSDLGAKGAAEQTNIDNLTKELSGLQDQLVVTSAAMQDSTQAQKEAGQVALQAAQDHLAAMQENQRMQVQLNELAATGTSQQVKAMLESNERQLSSLKAYQAAAIEYAQSLKQGSEENRLASEQAEAYGQQIELLTQQNERLTSSTLPIIEAREAEAAALAYQKQQLEETAEAVKGYNDDVAKLNSGLQASKDKLVETLDSIFKEAQKAAEDALDKLMQRRAEIGRDFARDDQKAERDRQTEIVNIQIDAQRAEIDAYKNYRRKLAQIQRDADADSFELILNRDFSGLFNLNRSTEKTKNEAAIEEREAIEDQREAKQRQLQDLQRSYEIERQERQIAMQQQIADAVAAYQQERIQIETMRNEAQIKARAAAAKEQQLLQQQLDARATAIRAELQLIQQGEQTRLQITNQAMQALVNQAKQLLAAFSAGVRKEGGGGSVGRAYGGGLAAFATSLVNELPGQRESFSTGGQSFMLPQGVGSFTPFKSGTVNSNGGGSSGGSTVIYLTQQITGGANAELIADIATKKAMQVFKRVSGVG